MLARLLPRESALRRKSNRDILPEVTPLNRRSSVLDELGNEHRLLLLSRSGSGHVLQFPVDPQHLILTETTPKVDEWRTTRGIEDFAAVVHDNKLYIIGGNDLKQRQRLDTAKCYDPREREWQDLPPMACRRSNFMAASFHGYVMVTGGQRSKTVLTSSSERFRPEEQGWEKCGPLRGMRAGLSGCVHDNNLLCSGGVHEASGGAGGFVGTDRVWVYRDVGENESWYDLDADCPQLLSKPIARHSMVSVGSKVYFIGGLKTWTDGRDLTQCTEPLMESFRLGLALGGKVGGSIVDPDDVSEAFTPADMRDWMTPWDRTLPPPRIPRHNAAAVAFGNSIYLFGGSSTHSSETKGVREVEVFDTLRHTWTTEFRLKDDAGDVSNLTAVFLKFPPRDRNFRARRLLRQKNNDEVREVEEEEGVDTRLGWILW